MTSLQDRVDAIEYPPTHTYQLKGLIPTSWLAKRMEVINRVSPTLFKGKRFLDVGCNKGYFMLKAAQNCEKVVAIDPVDEYANLCRCIAPKNCDVFGVSFGEYRTTEVFDRIFIGNGPHYPFREAGGWSWVDRIAEMSDGLVVVEGPIGMECSDMTNNNCIPEHLRPLFCREKMFEAWSRRFFVRSVTPSPLVDRYIMVFEKKDELYWCDMATYADYLKYVYGKMARKTTPDDVVLEVCTRHDRGVLSKEIIPHSVWMMADRDPRRPGLNIDVLKDGIPPVDVIVSTAILHHTPTDKVPLLIERLCEAARRCVMISGPNAKVMTELIGDHEYHIDTDEIETLAEKNGFSFSYERTGLSRPLCEVLVTLERK